jgi:membrane protein
MKPQRLLRLSQKAVMAWIDDFAPSMGAAISYYTMFSLAPLLVIVIAVAGVLFGREAVQGEIVGQLKGLIGLEGAMAVQGLMRSASEPSRGLAAGLISAVVVLVGATTVFAELQSALDRIWHVPEKAKPSGVWAVLRARVLSFGLILGLAFMLMVSLVTSAAVAALGSWASGLLPAWEVTLQALNTAAALAITTVLLQWHDVWVGAAVTAVLFELGKFAIGMYLGKSGVDEAFAAAGSLVVVLAWVYYAAQIFLLGAEFTKVYAEERGSQAGADAVAATRTGAAVAAAGTDLTPGLLPAAALEATPTAAQAGSHAAPTELEILQARTRQQQVHLGLLAAVAVGQLALLRWRRQQLQRLLGRAASSRDS